MPGRAGKLSVVVGGAALVCLVACGLQVIGNADVEPAVSGPGSDADTLSENPPDGSPKPIDPEAGTEGGSGDPCGTNGGPPMVLIDGKFCIDAHEATNEEYLPFLLASEQGSIGTVPAACAWNTVYKPPGWPVDAPYFATTEADAPVHPVDWCDAWMFCQWYGKRLCGSVTGKAMPPESAADASTNAWTYACSAAGTKTYPYGTSYDGTACNTGQALDATPAPATQHPRCVGGYPGVFSMSGNAWEWDDTCGPGGASASCRLRGGSLTRGPELTLCSTAYASPRNDATGNNGIRCCKY